MPFAQIQYRQLRNSPLGWQQRRNRFLCISITYTVVFLIIGAVFLGLFLNEQSQLNNYNCSICAYYGTPYSCGFQQCCDSIDGYNSYFYNSYQFCLGDYGMTIFFIIMIVCFVYVLYEVFLIVCIMCTASAFSPRSDVVVVNGQTMGLANNYSSPYGNNVVIT
jgi:hypothetical protein